MRYTIRNDVLKVEVDSHGAEVKSVVRLRDGFEFMWQADPKYWNRTSPVLFPFVGSLKGKQYRWLGKSMPMGQHGFARDMEHSLIGQTENSLLFRVTDTEETLAKFPFRFVLEIGYTLDGSTLSVSWTVKNPADNTLYFSIGAHPAFNCPVYGEADKSGYMLHFGGIDSLHYRGNGNAGGLAEYEDLILPLENHCAVITPEFFDRATYIAEGSQTGEVGILTPDGKMLVNVRFDAPLFGIWSPEHKNAPFLCIEPWYGRCDAVDFNGELPEREYGQQAAPGESFRAGYSMEFGV